MSLSFTAVDFETANSSRASACAVGAVKVVGGVITEEFQTLIRPPEGHDFFHPGNTRIHGLVAHDVRDAPQWPQVYRKLMQLIGDDIFVAHNAAFDMSVLKYGADLHGLTLPHQNSFCTVDLSRKALRLSSNSLPNVVAHLQLQQFQHHDALADARACAQVLLAIADLTGSASFTQLRNPRRAAASTSSKMRSASAPGISRAPVAAPDTATLPVEEAPVGDSLKDHSVVITGDLESMGRPAAQKLIRLHGGVAQDNVTRKTTLVIAGDYDLGMLKEGARYTNKLQKAFDYLAKGVPLQIICENELLEKFSISGTELTSWLSRQSTSKDPSAWMVDAKRTGIRMMHVPDHVLDQGVKLEHEISDPESWLDQTLSHPEGPAQPGAQCLWCHLPTTDDLEAIHARRQVCGPVCDLSLRHYAVQIWERNGVLRHQEFFPRAVSKE